MILKNYQEYYKIDDKNTMYFKNIKNTANFEK